MRAFDVLSHAQHRVTLTVMLIFVLTIQPVRFWIALHAVGLDASALESLLAFVTTSVINALPIGPGPASVGATVSRVRQRRHRRGDRVRPRAGGHGVRRRGRLLDLGRAGPGARAARAGARRPRFAHRLRFFAIVSLALSVAFWPSDPVAVSVKE